MKNLDGLRIRLRATRSRQAAGVVLALSAFAIFAWTALSVYRSQYSPYIIERFGLAAAVSNLVYGAPVGSLYAGILNKFMEFGRPAQDILAELGNGDAALGQLIGASADGNGIGFPLFASLALRVFGLRTEALGYGFLSLVGLSTIAFAIRYRDARLVVVPAAFLALTMMLFTQLARNPMVLEQAMFGGVRYFSLAGILPAFHLLLELADRKRQSRRMAVATLLLAGIQLMILFAAILVRGTPGYNLMGALFLFLLLLFWRRHDSGAVRLLAGKAAAIFLVGAIMASAFYLWVPPVYKETGRTMGIVWHRAVISLTRNPAWPFGDLASRYHCEPGIPGGLAAAKGDQVGHCVWVDYAHRHGIGDRQLMDEVYDRQYEEVLREGFFSIARSYPVETMRTFFIIKPSDLLETVSGIVVSMKWRDILFLLSCSILSAILIGVLLLNSKLGRITHVMSVVQVALILQLFAVLPPLVAWSNLATVWDNVFYAFLDGVILTICAIALLWFWKSDRAKTWIALSHK